jgi:hypothetical protein
MVNVSARANGDPEQAVIHLLEAAGIHEMICQCSTTEGTKFGGANAHSDPSPGAARRMNDLSDPLPQLLKHY